jgi:hypothetical protein
MGKFLKMLLPWNLMIFTSHFELPNGATRFLGLFLFQREYHPRLSGLNNVLKFVLHPITNPSLNIFPQFRADARSLFFTKPAGTFCIKHVLNNYCIRKISIQ